jgi:outer membrane protein TolC
VRAGKQLRTQQDLLSIIQLLYGKGLAAELQLRQAEGALAQVRASVPVLEAGLETAMNALDVMLGTSPGTHRKELEKAAPVPGGPAVRHNRLTG